MDLDPEDFKQTFAETWAERVKEGKVSSIGIGFPAEVIDGLQILGPPSWDLIEYVANLPARRQKTSCTTCRAAQTTP
jgi:hypothetical protein